MVIYVTCVELGCFDLSLDNYRCDGVRTRFLSVRALVSFLALSTRHSGRGRARGTFLVRAFDVLPQHQVSKIASD